MIDMDDRDVDMDGLCVACGGHGVVLTGARHVNEKGRKVLTFAPCRLCDGSDRVTPLLESAAEEVTEAQP